MTRVEGTAWIRTADGSKVAVKEGMRVPVNAEIITETGASVELEIPSSPSMTISDNRSFLVSGDIAETDVDPVAAALANPNDPAITAVLAALEAVTHRNIVGATTVNAVNAVLTIFAVKACQPFTDRTIEPFCYCDIISAFTLRTC